MGRSEIPVPPTMETPLFTANSKLADIMSTEGKVEILLQHGVPCVSCAMFGYELQFLEIGAVAETYGVNLDPLLADLNA